MKEPLTKQDLMDALGAMEQRLEPRLGAIERKLESGSYEQGFGQLENFTASASERLADLEAPDRLFELMLRVSENERRSNRPR